MFPKNSIQSSYMQFLNQKSTKCVCNNQLLVPKDAVFVSQNHFINLTNYRNYIKQQMKFLDTQFKRDQAQMILMQLRIQDATSVFCQQFQLLKNQLNQITMKKQEIIQQRNILQERNLNNVKILKQIFQKQEKLREKQNQIKSSVQLIKNQILQLKNQKGDGIIQKSTIKNKSIQQQITGNYQTQKNEQSNIQRLKQYSQDITKRTNHLLTLSIQAKQSIKIRQNYIKTLKNQNEKQQQQLAYLKNKIQLSQKNKAEIETKKLQILKVLEKQQYLQQIMQKQQDNLSYGLGVCLKNLELEQREREKEQDKIAKSVKNGQKAQKDLKRLKQYLKQLLQSNYTFEAMLDSFHKKDIILTASLLDRLLLEQFQNCKQNAQQRKIAKQYNYLKTNTTNESYDMEKYRLNYQNIQPYIQKPTTYIGAYTKINSMPIQNDFMQKKEKMETINDKLSKFDLLQRPKERQIMPNSFSANLLIQRVQRPLIMNNIKQSQLQNTAASEFQNNFRQKMPKQVSQIINKYKNKQNSTVLRDLLSSNKINQNYYYYDTQKYDKYTSIRPKILNQLMNYRPSASGWFKDENKVRIES